jgi:hypothetical protein
MLVGVQGYNKAHWWWLRSPGSNGPDYAANVNNDGNVNANGNNVNNDNGGVRPASPQCQKPRPELGRPVQRQGNPAPFCS